MGRRNGGRQDRHTARCRAKFTSGRRANRYNPNAPNWRAVHGSNAERSHGQIGTIPGLLSLLYGF
jgi:hypothetical protein